MANRLGITEGKWIIKKVDCNLFSNIYSEHGIRVAEVKSFGNKTPFFDATIKQRKCNAKLIADAGTTSNKCGLLPSELLEQRNELLQSLKDLLIYCRHNMTNQLEPIVNKSINAIKKAEQHANI